MSAVMIIGILRARQQVTLLTQTNTSDTVQPKHGPVKQAVVSQLTEEKRRKQWTCDL